MVVVSGVATGLGIAPLFKLAAGVQEKVFPEPLPPSNWTFSPLHMVVSVNSSVKETYFKQKLWTLLSPPVAAVNPQKTSGFPPKTSLTRSLLAVTLRIQST